MEAKNGARKGAGDTGSGAGSARLQQLLVQAGHLTGSEARVLVALMRLRTGTLKQLSEATEVNRSNIYPVLDSLAAKSLCQRLPGMFAVWECPEPREVLARLQRAEVARSHAALEVAERGFEEAETLLDDLGSGPEEPPLTLVDDARLGVIYTEAMASVEVAVLVLNRGPYPGEVRPDEAVLDAVARGVKARALYVDAELDSPEGQVRMCADAYSKAGVEQRVVDSLPVSMAVIDEGTALLNLPNRDASSAAAPAGAAIHHEGLVQLVSAGFEYLWAGARPYVPSPGGATGSNTAHEGTEIAATGLPPSMAEPNPRG